VTAANAVRVGERILPSVYLSSRFIVATSEYSGRHFGCGAFAFAPARNRTL
jgi:hypothetical protein